MKKLLAGVFVAMSAFPITPAFADHGGEGYRGGECDSSGGCYNEREEDYSGAGCKYFCPDFKDSPVDFRDNNITICFPFSVCDPGKKGEEGQTPAQPMP